MTQVNSFQVSPFSLIGCQISWFNPSLNQPSGVLGYLSEQLKKVIRCAYMLGVSILVAPIGCVSHLSQAFAVCAQSCIIEDKKQAKELNERSWKHLSAAIKDLDVAAHGVFALQTLKIMSYSTALLYIGILANHLALTAVTAGTLWFGKYIITNHTYLPLAWKSLTEVENTIK